MSFTYQNKPDPGDLLSVSQADLKNNFQYLQATLNKDHQVVFGDTNTSTFEGRHRQVALFGQTLPYTPPTDGQIGTVYAGSDRQVYFQEGSISPNPSLVRIQLTKAFGLYNTLGVAQGDSFNIASVTVSSPNPSQQTYVVNFTNPIRSTGGALSTNYIAFGQLEYISGGVAFSSVAGVTKTASSCKFDFLFFSASTIGNASFLVYGG